MEKNRQTKIIAIIALVVAVVGMSLGFAAFSNILTISSSATVTPNDEDFKLVAYGLSSDVDGNDFMGDFANLAYYTSKTSGRPVLGGAFNDSETPLGGETAVISRSNDQISISNIVGKFSGPQESIIYPFVVKNEGAYDAYLTIPQFLQTPKTCTPAAGATQELVDATCSEMELFLMVTDSSMDLIYDTSGSTDNLQSYKIEAGSYVVVMPYIWSSDRARADGEFTAQFDNITMNFSSAA